jgi:hypothetical protein
MSPASSAWSSEPTPALTLISPPPVAQRPGAVFCCIDRMALAGALRWGTDYAALRALIGYLI